LEVGGGRRYLKKKYFKGGEKGKSSNKAEKPGISIFPERKY